VQTEWGFAAREEAWFFPRTTAHALAQQQGEACGAQQERRFVLRERSRCCHSNFASAKFE
jgi:hypothetical protein